MKIIGFSLTYWQYPFLMSIFQFTQTFSGLFYETESLILAPILSAFSHLIAFLQEDILLYYDQKYSTKQLKRKDFSLQINLEQQFCFTKITQEQYSKRTKKYLYLLFLGLVNIFPHSLYMKYAKVQVVGSFQSFWNILYFILLLSSFEN